MNNIGLEVVFWTVLSLYLLAKQEYLKNLLEKEKEKNDVTTPFIRS